MRKFARNLNHKTLRADQADGQAGSWMDTTYITGIFFMKGTKFQQNEFLKGE